MNPPPSNQISLTLFELLVAMALLSLMVLGFASIDLFTRYQVLTADRRAQVQNGVSYVMEHMSKEIIRAIGNANQVPQTVRIIPISGEVKWLWVWIDYNQNGKCDTASDGDRAISYWYSDTGGILEPDRAYEIWYSPACTDITTCFNSASNNVLSRKITSFIPAYNSNNNFLDITLTGCWNPTSTAWSCGTSDNPSVTMRTRIMMPSVSTN